MRQIFFFTLCLICSQSIYAKDKLQQSNSIALNAMQVQAERIKVASENIANEHSTATKPEQDPYRRKIIFAENRYSKKNKTNLLRVRKVGHSKADFILKYQPDHPAANSEGYVKYPNVNRLIERADATEAQRSYEANLGVIETNNNLIQKTIEAMN